jgi:hypothetical protein
MTIPDVKAGDVFLLRSRGYWYSDAIAWFMGKDSTGCQLSHCGVIIDYGRLSGPITLETSDYEVTYGALFKYVLKPDKYHLRVYRLPESAWASPADMASSLADADDKLYGRVYGYLQLLSLGLRRLLMRIGVKVPNFIRQGQVCTAVALTYLSKSQMKVFSGIDPEAIDTVEFADMIHASESILIFTSGKPAT